MGTISQMVSPLYHTRRGLSSQDMMKQHMGIRNVLHTPVFWNTLNLEIVVLTPLEFACGVSLIADA
jgi:hypothetical protein